MNFMIKAIHEIKKGRGRPKTTGAGVIIASRWHGDDLGAIDEWRRRQADLPSRPAAIRRLVLLALRAKQEK